MTWLLHCCSVLQALPGLNAADVGLIVASVLSITLFLYNQPVSDVCCAFVLPCRLCQA